MDTEAVSKRGFLFFSLSTFQANIWIVRDRRDYILKVININQSSKLAAFVSSNYWGVQQLGGSCHTGGFWPSPCSSPRSNGGLSLSHRVESSPRKITEQPMETSSAQGKDVSPWFAAWNPGRTQPLALLLLGKVLSVADNCCDVAGVTLRDVRVSWRAHFVFP